MKYLFFEDSSNMKKTSVTAPELPSGKINHRNKTYKEHGIKRYVEKIDKLTELLFSYLINREIWLSKFLKCKITIGK